MFVLASLSSEQIEALRRFEKSEGIKVLALKEVPVETELLAADKLAALRDLEDQIGVCLLAVR